MIQNKTIRSLSIHRKKPWYLWLNTTPFFITEALLFFPLLYVHFDILQHLLVFSDEGMLDDEDSIVIGGDLSTQETTILGFNALWWLISLILVIISQIGLLLASYWSVAVRTFLQYSSVRLHIDQVSLQLEQYAKELPTTASTRSSRRAASRRGTASVRLERESEGTESLGYVVRVVPQQHKGHMEICPLGYSTNTGSLYFSYQKRRYQYNSDKHRFEKPSLNMSNTLRHYRKSKGISESDVQRLAEIHGLNRFDIPMPSFLELYKEHALAPFFVFQVFCVILWCLDEYWYYSLMTLVMLFMFEGTVVKQRMRNLEQVKQMATKPEIVYVYRGRKWTEIMSDKLLPNDIVSVVKQAEGKVCPCDVLLIEGKCVTNESLLTGESIPQMKESLQLQHDNGESEDDEMLDIKKRHKRHVIFGGTRIMHHQQTIDDNNSTTSRRKSPNNGAVGVVLRTGFETAQGKLIRTILYTTERVSANNLEALLFILFLLVFAVIASTYVLLHGLQDPSRSRYKLLLNCILIITSCVPPELPMELSLAVNTSLMFLVRFGVFCTEPFRIPFAGKVNVCCFDKTGTLTSDKMVMTGVVECDTKGDHKVIQGKNARREVKAVLAGCHSLINLDGEVVGDPMEKAALDATDFTVLDTTPASAEAVVVPQNAGTASTEIAMITILKRFAFTSELKRMSCIVKIRDDVIVVSKGAPEIMKSMISSDSLPDNYDDMLEEYAISGARVITLAHRTIFNKQTFRKDSLARLTREDVEKDLVFAGFALFESDIKMGTAEAIDHLLESSHKVIMITGDNAMTACHVARKLRMVTKPVLVLTLLDSDGGDDSDTDSADRLIWHAHQEQMSVLGSGSQSVDQLLEQYDLCVQGDALEALLKCDTKWLERHAADIAVYARVAPEQKEHVLSLLKSQGNFTLMCGDGTNDVGALKQAHVGVALLDGKIDAEKWASLDRPVSFMQQIKEQQERQRLFAEERKRLMELAKSGDREAASKLKQLTIRQFMGPTAASEGEAPLVKLGDASIASPFSSKYSTIRSTEKILQQGRCTLVTTLQMYKILALNCLISAYSLSVLYLDGVKYGDTQMLTTGLLIALCFLFISRAKPLDRLSSERPQSTIFNPYMMLSIMGQFAIHLVSLILTVQAAKSIAPRTGPVDMESEYEPNLLNTAVFLITSAQTVATFSNNYRGRPFMESLFEHKPLLYCLSALFGLIVVLTAGIMPELNHQMELVLIPNQHIPLFMGIMAINLAGVFIYERLLLRLFKQ